MDEGLGDDLEDRAPTEKEIARLVRVEREKKRLVDSLRAEDFSTLLPRVAAILNLYPATRDSDVVLSLKYWETFQPEIYNPAGIKPADLFVLERYTNVVRARAKIQNDFGLFLASGKVRLFRKKHEESIKSEIILTAPDERGVLRVFADETGKTGNYVMVAAVWVLTGRAVFTISRAISEWKENSPFRSREMHFTRLGRDDGPALSTYLDIIAGNLEFLSFKIIGVERARTRRPIAEVVAKLHEHMLKSGTEHEVRSRRVSLPREIEVTLDEEDSLDDIALTEIRHSVEQFLDARFDGALSIREIAGASSKISPLLQLADLVAGAANRRRNHQGERNYKDEFADLIVDRLGLVVEQGEDELFDSSILIKL